MFNGARGSVWGGEKVLETQRWGWLQNSVNVLNAAELCTSKQLQWPWPAWLSGLSAGL